MGKAGRAEDAEDRRLIDGVVRRDVSSLRSLHDRYHGRVRGFAIRMVRTPELAEEVAADTMVAVWQGAARFEGRSKVSTWIFGIAYRIALKAVSRSLRGPAQVPLEAAAGLADTEAVPPEARIDLDRVTRAMRALPVEMRAVMELTYYYGHSISEVAEITGVPAGTIKSRMFAARGRLKEALR